MQMEKRAQQANGFAISAAAKLEITFGQFEWYVLGDTQIKRLGLVKWSKLQLQKCNVAKAKIDPLRQNKQQRAALRIGWVECDSRSKVSLKDRDSSLHISLDKRSTEPFNQGFCILFCAC